MTSRHFQFLEAEWPLLCDSAAKAESLIHSDARAACFYARRSLELAVAWLYKYDGSLRLPYGLYESPFIDLSPMGPEGLFSSANTDKLMDILAGIRARAA